MVEQAKRYLLPNTIELKWVIGNENQFFRWIEPKGLWFRFDHFRKQQQQKPEKIGIFYIYFFDRLYYRLHLFLYGIYFFGTKYR